jgi:hypothetical protein
MSTYRTHDEQNFLILDVCSITFGSSNQKTAPN